LTGDNMFETRKKYTGSEYFKKQVHLMRWFVIGHGHSENEYVHKFAKLFETHHLKGGRL